MAYQPGIPTGSVPLNQDYLNIQGNFTALNNYYGTDHIPLTNVTPGTVGYHTALHLVPQTSVTATPGYGNLYVQTTNDGVNTGQQLFYQFVNGTPTTITVPLTRNLQPKLSSNGYTYLPGGFILQWGFVNGSRGGSAHLFDGGDIGTVTFSTSNIAFPSNCYSIWTQPMFTSGNAPSSSNAATVGIATNFTKTAFNWEFLSSSGSYSRFFWFAIGN